MTVASASAQTSSSALNTGVVRQFMHAFNAHDAQAMATLVTDDIRWLSVRGVDMAIELEGKTALSAGMAEYFKACTSCRAELRGVVSSNERVSAVEVARWQSSRGPQSQQSMVVYEFSDGLIRAVY